VKLKLLRNRFNPEWTTGQLYVNDEFFCFTLEDEVREPYGWSKEDGVPIEQWKVKGETAIPRGIYSVVFENSPHFGPDTLTLKNVPGFSHIRIHAGNTEKDTDGCILVGYRITDNGVIVPGTTRPALADLKALLKPAFRDITIQII